MIKTMVNIVVRPRLEEESSDNISILLPFSENDKMNDGHLENKGSMMTVNDVVFCVASMTSTSWQCMPQCYGVCLLFLGQ